MFVCLALPFCMFLVFYLDYFIPVLLVVLLGLVFSVLSQEIGWEEHLQNHLFCVKWDIKP